MQNMAEPEAEEQRPRYAIASVDNALRLLALFGQHSSVRIYEASEELGIGRSTAHRLMAMLQYHGYVIQDTDTKVYRFGPALIELGLSALRDLDIANHIRPFLDQLSNATGETAALHIWQGNNVLLVDVVEPDRAVRASSRIGTKVAAHASAGGKALLAELPAERLRQLYPEPELPVLTEKTVASRAALERELTRVRRQGYATSFGEVDDDLAAIGVALANESGTVRVALTIDAPRTRLTARAAPAVGALLAEAAAGIRSGLT